MIKLYQKERVDRILNIIRETGYVNVKYLCDEIGYSKATVNRDLNFMEKQKMVRRSYGGVEIVENKGVPLPFRYHKMKKEKMKICKAAAGLIDEGDTVFIDASSTTEFIAHYLSDKKDVTVITNNIAIVTYLSDFQNINVVCLGGELIEPPCMLGGDLCAQNAISYKADKFFFSTHGIEENGEIGGSSVYNLVCGIMAHNSKKVVYLVDHTKFNLPSKRTVMTLNDVDVVISDFEFPKTVCEKFRDVEFISV